MNSLTPVSSLQETTQPIETRILGRTSLRVSVVSFGASPLGNVFRLTDPAEGVAAVHFAIDRGINFFDVSPYYGMTVAESRLGEALEGYRDRVVLATKCGRYGDDEFDFSAPTVITRFEDSLRRLRTDHVDLLQAHDVEFGDVNQIVMKPYRRCASCSSRARRGMSVFTGYSLRNLLEIASRVAVDSILTYCRYNLLIDDLEEKLVPFAKEHAVGLINASALHMGILTERGAPSWHPAPETVREAGRMVMRLCAERGIDGSELALKYCFDNRDVATTLVGMSTRHHVAANLNALAVRTDPQLLAEIRTLIGTALQHDLALRSGGSIMAEWIDAHHHLWRYNRAEFDWIDDSMQPLQRDFLVSDLVHETTRAGVDGTVVVQARQTLEETYWLLDCAEQTHEILGVVGWVPLAGDDLPKVLRQLLTRPLFKGVRHVVQGEPDNFLMGDAFNRGISALLDAGLTYDLLIQEHQLREAKAFVGRHPQQRFVIDHVAKPKITARQMEPWRSNLLRLADCTNVSCKVSGMVTEADWAMWTAADVEPFLEVALDAFGPDRLIAGSDWPVCLVASSYKRWWSTLFEWAQKLSAFDREALFGGNARKFYVLNAAHGLATSTVTTGFPNH